MELLNHPETKITYDKCKYRVKLWEHEFKKQKGRLPSKLDIREASTDVRYAYKMYYKLKTAFLEESLSNIDVFDNLAEPDQEAVPVAAVDENVANNDIICEDTWGTHLNNSNTLSHKKDRVETPTVNKSFSQKLFKSSKSSKLRKSLSFVRQKSVDDDKPCFLSQPESSSTSMLDTRQDNNIVAESKCNDETQNNRSDLREFRHNNGYFLSKVKEEVPKTFMQPVNIIQSALNSNFNKSIQSVNAEWVERAAKNIIQDVENSSTNFTSSHTYNVDIKLDCDSDDVVEESDTEQDGCSIYHIAKKQKIDECSVPKEHDICNISQNLITVNLEVERNDFSNIFSSRSTQPDDSRTINKLPVQGGTLKVNNKSNVSICDNFSANDDFNNISTNRNTNINLKDKKPKQTVPSGDVNTRSINKKNSNSLKEKKLEQKIASGTLNENYVQINLQKKKYVRGKNFKSFSSYKKKQWKKKKNALYGPDMDMGGCDGGMLTCFNCGGTGHFARKCKNGKSDALLPLQENQEEDCPLPTLEEAERMARESVLAVRKSSRTLTADADNLINNAVDDRSQSEVTCKNNDYFSDNDEADLLAATELLEKKIVQEQVKEYIHSTTRVKPYYELQNGKLIDIPEEVFDTLKLFGHTSFRMGQETAIMRILSGQSTLVTLSTGSGKSLCYQLPAYLYSKREPCISLIISPLVSLMEDQVTGIPFFIKAACLHTNQTKTQREKVMEAISMGNLNILLVSPEAIVAGDRSTAFGSLLNKLPPIAFACIDEAHCVSQWSHNFRPSYLKICHVLRERLGVTTILGLTATATRATSDSIISHICIPDGRSGIISDVPLPDNLRLTVSRDVQRDQALLGLLLTERFMSFKSIIVYCTRREECGRVAAFLRTSLKNEAVAATMVKTKKRKRVAVQAEPYHAGLSASRRKTIQKTFMNGELRIVVATVAFGMGINKSDIESVIHYNMPMSFESYVQEVGRAGRNGLSAHCHLFLDSQGKDQNELRRHIYSNCVDRCAIRKLLQLCFVSCSCKTTCPRHEVAFSIEETIQALDVAEENIETLLCYLELHEKKFIKLLSHAYINCKIISYDGPNAIKKAAKDCPPLAMALALFKNQKDKNIFEFPVVKVAADMGWDSGICKSKLKNLEWVTVNGQPQRSKLNVEFINLGFRILAPGNLPDSELDEAQDSLYSRVKDQEQTALLQLHNIYTTLTSVAVPTFKKCVSEEETSDNEKQLKSAIREYFERDKPLTSVLEPSQPVDEGRIRSDVRALINMYRDNSFTGRAVARIFHGIQSPNYPAVIWGRCKFWRAYLGTDFHAISQIAKQEIIQMR